MASQLFYKCSLCWWSLQSGEIIIEGIDICKLDLHDLRSCFGIVPQEPILYQGTARSNIDPIDSYPDEDIWKINTFILAPILFKFESEVIWLICLPLVYITVCRALNTSNLKCSSRKTWKTWKRQRDLECGTKTVMLKRYQILFMDEATASVDSQTDSVLHAKSSTLLTGFPESSTEIKCWL